MRPVELPASGRHLDLGHARGGRSVPRPGDHGLDRVGRSLQHGFDAAVATVAHPAGNPGTLRLSTQGFAKAHALDPTKDTKMLCIHFQNVRRNRGGASRNAAYFFFSPG